MRYFGRLLKIIYIHVKNGFTTIAGTINWNPIEDYECLLVIEIQLNTAPHNI